MLSLRSKGYSGDCWGYNFDWQGRRIFLFPKNTPTVVATTFCVNALLEAFEITRDKRYLDSAVSSAKFIINDLHRSQCKEGFLFSYSPLQGNNKVINASLLGAKSLSLISKYEEKEEYRKLAKETIETCCQLQEEDGSWIYGLGDTQSWKDSFHTGYNLDALISYRQCTQDDSFDKYIDKGYEYYIKNFFTDNGVPKYYNNTMYPIDIHCPGQLLVTLSRLDKFEENRELIDKVLSWTIENMQDKKGYFYYQIKQGIDSKISYMRWSNAFMFNALSYYLMEISKK